jgi:NADH:ubiquinone oxidoreductase subunit 2 (subunit N)
MKNNLAYWRALTTVEKATLIVGVVAGMLARSVGRDLGVILIALSMASCGFFLGMRYRRRQEEVERQRAMWADTDA